MMVGSRSRWSGNNGILAGGKNLKLSIEIPWANLAMACLYTSPDSRPLPSSYPLPRRKNQNGENPTQHLWIGTLGLPTPCWLPWYKEFPGYQTVRNPSTALSSAMLCREIRYASQSPVQSGMGPSQVYGTPDASWWGKIVEASLLVPKNNELRASPTPAEEAVHLGDKLEPQKTQEAAALLGEHLEETPKSKETVEWSETPNPPVLSAIASNASDNQPCATRRAWHGTRSRHPAALDPLDNPSEWVLTYLAERDKPPSWWLEFWSLHHREVGPLSIALVLELARKQVVAFRLPAAHQEKSSWWNIPPSLPSLGHQDFLPPSPPKSQGPRDIWVVRGDQTVELERGPQQCT